MWPTAMEAASSSIVYTLPFTRSVLCNTKSLCCLSFRSGHCSFPLFSSILTRSSNLSGKCFRSRCLSPSRASEGRNPSQELAVLLEVEGVLLDAHHSGNRQSFNIAFQKLGLDCANWSEPIYLDLLRKCSTDEKRMLVMYFNRIGWPTSLPTHEKEIFVRNVLREKKCAMDELVASQSLSLRPGVQDFIDTAHGDEVPVVILTAYSKSSDGIARFIIDKLGNERISKLKIVGNEEVKKSSYNKLVLGSAISSGLDEQLSKEVTIAASSAKQKIAEDVASALKLSVDINTTPSESFEKIISALRAGAEYAGVPVPSCVLVAGCQSGVDGAVRVGMPCVVLRSSSTSRAEFPLANAVMDGFGGADLTISKLRDIVCS